MNQKSEHIYFEPESGFMLVRIDPDTYGFENREVHYQGKTFQPKDELHITIISQQAAQEVSQFLEREPEEQVALRELIDRTDWSYQKMPDFYHVREEPGVESIIQMVEVPELKSFWKALSQKVGKAIAMPPTHVTLYVLGTEKGIGLPSQEVFQERVVGALNPKVIGLSST